MFQLSEQQGLERCWGTTICSLQGKSFHRISGLSFMFILPNGICEKGTKTSVFLPLNPGGSYFLKSVLSPAHASEQLCLVVQTDILHSQPPPLLHTFKLQSLKGVLFKKETSCIFQKTVQVLYWVDHTYRKNGFESPTCLDPSGGSKVLQHFKHHCLPVSPLSHVNISNNTNNNSF